MRQLKKGARVTVVVRGHRGPPPKSSFRSDSDKGQLPFVKTQTKNIFLLLGLWASFFLERQTPADGTSTMMIPGEIMSLIILRQSEDLSFKTKFC